MTTFHRRKQHDKGKEKNTASAGSSLGISATKLRQMYNLYYTTAEVVADARGGMQSLAKNVCYVIAAETEETAAARLEAANSDSAQLQTAIRELHDMYPDSEYVKKTEATYNEVVEGAQTWISMVQSGADKHDLYVEFESEIVPGLTQLKDDILELEAVSHDNANSAYMLALIIAIVFSVIAVILVILLFVTVNDGKRKLSYGIITPVAEVTEAAKQMSEGHLDLDIKYESLPRSPRFPTQSRISHRRQICFP